MSISWGPPLSRRSGALLLGAVAYAALLAGSDVVPSVAGVPVARAARSLNVKDEGHLHLVHESGSLLVEEGSVTGTLPGRVKVSFNVGATITARFTIYAHGGSVSGHGSGALHST